MIKIHFSQNASVDQSSFNCLIRDNCNGILTWVLIQAVHNIKIAVNVKLFENMFTGTICAKMETVGYLYDEARCSRGGLNPTEKQIVSVQKYL